MLGRRYIRRGDEIPVRGPLGPTEEDEEACSKHPIPDASTGCKWRCIFIVSDIKQLHPSKADSSRLPDNAIFHFCKQAKKCGVDIFRIFDALNDINQLEVGMKA